jgi:hypothetical protein
MADLSTNYPKKDEIGGKLLIVKAISVWSRSKPLSSGVPRAIAFEKLSFETNVIRIPHKVLRNQVYYEIEILPKEYLDGTEKFVIPVDNLSLLGFLTSSLFAIWVKGIGKMENISITEKTMYNNFPFPDLTKKQSQEIDKAVNYVFEARGECRFNKLMDVYTPETMPDFLVRAHENLDKVLCDIMGIPKDATSEQVLDSLYSKYLEMMNA